MRKLISLLILSIASIALYAQTNPNRLLIRESSGNVKGYLVERIDSMYFVNEPGRVAADVEFLSYENDAERGDIVHVAVTRTEKCQAFRITVCPANVAGMLNNDAAVASYLESYAPTLYWNDFTDGEMSGFEKPFSSNADYSIFTVGYDQYGIACSVSRADFTTPKQTCVGNPQVEWTLDDVGTTEFTISFKPNADTGGYSFCLFGKGEAEEQLNMFGAMFGLASISDMVKAWGVPHQGDYTYTYTGQAPGKEYELYIQPWDINGVDADLIIVPVTMKNIGGTGLAQMEITIGEFGEFEGQHYQYVTYTPNAEVSLHRDMIIEKNTYESEEWGEEGVLRYLKSDNPFDPYWDQFGVDEAVWNVDPSTTYIAFSIGKNINDEWGPLASKEFTTPASVSDSQAPKRILGKVPGVPVRKAKDVVPVADFKRMFGKGMPVKRTGGVKLMQK